MLAKGEKADALTYGNVTVLHVAADRIRVRITEAHACPTLGRLSVYRAG